MRPTPEKKEEILHAALKRFLKVGVRKASFNDIAKEVGLTANLLSYQFKDKEELVIGCADRFHRDHIRESRRICDSNLDPQAKLKIYVLNRFYAWRELHNPTQQAQELEMMMMRVAADSFNLDEDLFVKTLTNIIEQGNSARIFRVDKPEREARLATISLSACFPMAGAQRPRQPGDKELIELAEWFVGKWKRR